MFLLLLREAASGASVAGGLIAKICHIFLKIVFQVSLLLESFPKIGTDLKKGKTRKSLDPRLNINIEFFKQNTY